MSAVKYADAGMAAITARNWDDAITNLSKAIDQSKSPAWLLARSQAYMEKKDLDRALRDAEFAYCTAAERGNDKSRQQMIEAQYRRSVVYFRKKRYADADICAVWSQQLAKGIPVRSADTTADKIDGNGMYHATVADVNPDLGKGQGKQKQEEVAEAEQDSSRFAQIYSLLGASDDSKVPYEKDWKKAHAWRSTIIGFLERLPKDDPARKVTVKLVPTKPSLEDKIEEKRDPQIDAAKAELKQAAHAQPTNLQPANNSPFRSQMYQSDRSIAVSLFMKFASKEETEKVKVDIQPNLITVTGVPREPSTAYIVPHAAIIPVKSTYRVAIMKIEFTLAKAAPGKWPDFGKEELNKPDTSLLPQDGVSGPPAAATPSTSTTTTGKYTKENNMPKPKGPAYPTSAKGGPKDWDHIRDDDEKDDGSGGDVDSFFKKLYKDATPDQQRAMMKSFQESNGTALSTDWNSVSKETVKTTPPNGMEAKKWGA